VFDILLALDWALHNFHYSAGIRGLKNLDGVSMLMRDLLNNGIASLRSLSIAG